MTVIKCEKINRTWLELTRKGSMSQEKVKGMSHVWKVSVRQFFQAANEELTRKRESSFKTPEIEILSSILH